MSELRFIVFAILGAVVLILGISFAIGSITYYINKDCTPHSTKIMTKDGCDIYHVGMCAERDFKYVVCPNANTKTIQEYTKQEGKITKTYSDDVEVKSK